MCQAIKEMLEDAKTEGIAKGKAEGIVEGKTEGERINLENNIKTMSSNGASNEMIAKLLNMNISEVNAILVNCK